MWTTPSSPPLSRQPSVVMVSYSEDTTQTRRQGVNSTMCVFRILLTQSTFILYPSFVPTEPFSTKNCLTVTGGSMWTARPALDSMVWLRELSELQVELMVETLVSVLLLLLSPRLSAPEQCPPAGLLARETRTVPTMDSAVLMAVPTPVTELL